MAGANVCGMPLLPPARAAAAAAAAATATGIPTDGLGLLLLGLLLVIGAAAVGVRRVLLPYVRARHPNTGNVIHFNDCGTMGLAKLRARPAARRANHYPLCPTQRPTPTSHDPIDTGYIPGNEAGHLLQHTCNVPVIHALLVVETCVTVQDVVAVLRNAGVPHERFQRLAQCVSSRPGESQVESQSDPDRSSYVPHYTDRHAHTPFPPGTHEPFEPSRGDWPAYWVKEEGFDLAHHVRELPAGMDHAQLTAYLGSVANTPPSFDRSPWEVLVRGVRRCVITHRWMLLHRPDQRNQSTQHVPTPPPTAGQWLCRTRHDGGGGPAASRAWGRALVDGPARGHHAATAPKGRRQVGSGQNRYDDFVLFHNPYKPHPSPQRRLHTPHSSSLDAALRVGIKTRPEAVASSSSRDTRSFSLAALGALARRWIGLLGLGLRMCVELPWVVRRDFVAPPRETNIFRPPAPLSGKKAVGYRLAALELSRCRRVKDALGVKLNDVLLACAGGALRRMHGHIHDSLHGATATGKRDGGWGDVIPEEEEEEEEVKEPTTRTKPRQRSAFISSSTSRKPPPPEIIRFFGPMSCRTNLRG